MGWPPWGCGTPNAELPAKREFRINLLPLDHTKLAPGKKPMRVRGTCNPAFSKGGKPGEQASCLFLHRLEACAPA
jgi:hypothetical protein